MELNRIDILIERYWNCVSTVEEERELQEFFNSNEVPDSMAEVAQLFKYYTSQQQKKMKDKAFARAVNRQEIISGTEELGITLEEHIQFCIEAMKEKKDLLGL